jgi:hypothetical protein
VSLFTLMKENSGWNFEIPVIQYWNVLIYLPQTSMSYFIFAYFYKISWVPPLRPIHRAWDHFKTYWSDFQIYFEDEKFIVEKNFPATFFPLLILYEISHSQMLWSRDHIMRYRHEETNYLLYLLFVIST